MGINGENYILFYFNSKMGSIEERGGYYVVMKLGAQIIRTSQESHAQGGKCLMLGTK